MSEERTHDLAALCTRLVRNGNDFPTVWNTLLKNHTLVAGLPQSKIEGIRTILEIRPITGERRDLSARYLKDPALSLNQIAWLLGYSMVSSLNHAFHRWTGSSPKAWV
jgi:AraC-like DNA-binding protein